MSFDDGSGEPTHIVRMRRMMRFVRGLISESGDSLEKIADLANRLAARDGCSLDLNGPAVGRFGGQGDWYVLNASDFKFMRLYYILRALDSSLAECERAMDSAAEISTAESAIIISAFQRIHHPRLREYASDSVRELANLDATLPRDRAAYNVLPGPLNPPEVEEPEPMDDRPSLGEMGQGRIAAADNAQDGRPQNRRRSGGQGGGDAGGAGE